MKLNYIKLIKWNEINESDFKYHSQAVKMQPEI